MTLILSSDPTDVLAPPHPILYPPHPIHHCTLVLWRNWIWRFHEGEEKRRRVWAFITLPFHTFTSFNTLTFHTLAAFITLTFHTLLPVSTLSLFTHFYWFQHSHFSCFYRFHHSHFSHFYRFHHSHFSHVYRFQHSWYQCTMGKLKNRVKSSQLWQPPWILTQKSRNFAHSSLNSPQTKI